LRYSPPEATPMTHSAAIQPLGDCATRPQPR
jgi:hypothetical protein